MTDITIKQVRAKFPQYDDLNDQQLADALHQKYYADMPQQDFYAKVGLGGTPPADPTHQPGGFTGMNDALAVPQPPRPRPDPRMTPAAPVQPAAPSGLPSLDQPAPPAAAPAVVPGSKDAAAVDLLAAMGGADTTDGARAGRGLGRTSYLDGLIDAPKLPSGQAPAVPVDPLVAAMGGAPDPFAGEGFGPLAKRRGQQFARGATEVGASVPEGIAIAQAGIDRAAREGAIETAAGREEAIAELEGALAQPDLAPEKRAFLQSRLDAFKQGQQVLSEQAAQPVVPASERPEFAKGDQLRDRSAEIFGQPDPRDTSFWAGVAEGAGNMTALAAGAIATGPAGLATGAGLGASMNTSQLYKEALEAGASEDDAMRASRWGAAIGASEIVPISRALKLLPPRLRGQVGNRFFRTFADIAQSSGEEAAQEYLATVANNIVAQKIYDPERGWTEGATEAALIGAVLGGGMGAVGAAVGGDNEGAAAPPPPDREREQEPQDRPWRDPEVGDDAAAQGPQDQSDAGKAEALANIRRWAQSTEGAGITSNGPMRALEGEARRRGATDEEIEDAFSGEPQNIPENIQTPAPQPAPDQQTQPAAQGGRVEIMDETETVNGETRPTGRKVAVNLDTGEVSPVEPDGSPDQREAVQSRPQDAPDVGTEDAPAAEGAPEAEPDVSNIRTQTLTSEEVGQVDTDAKTFQYKDNGDADGVTDRLQGITDWDERSAMGGIVYEYADGRRVVADGHQRLGLAKRLQGQGKQTPWNVEVIREADGYTPQDVRRIAALKNVREGSGTAIDAAKVLREAPGEIDSLNLPPKSALVRDAKGLAKLSDDAFGMVVNEVVSPEWGAAVGENVSDPAMHADVVGLLKKLNPKNNAQAAMIARQAGQEVATETQASLFGDEQVSQSLYLERAKVLDNALKRLKQDRATFKVLTDRAGTISDAGNVLNAEANAQRVEADSTAAAYLNAEANRKGPISDALSAAARDFKANPREGHRIVTDFLAAVRDATGDQPEAGGSDRGAADRPAAESQDQQVAQDQAPGGDLFGDQPGQPNRDQARKDRDEAAVRANQSKIRKSGGNAGDAGPLFDTQGDMLDQAAKMPEPSNTAGTYVDRAPQPGDSLFHDRSGELPDRIAPGSLGAEAQRLTVEPGKRDGIEYLMLIDGKGQIVAYGSGHETGTGMAGSMALMFDDRESIVVHHNHPNSSPFSPADLAFMLSPGTHGVYAHGHDGSVIWGRATPLGLAMWQTPGVDNRDSTVLHNRGGVIMQDLTRATNNLWRKMQDHIPRLAADVYPDVANQNSDMNKMPGRDRNAALIMAMRDAGIIEIEVTGTLAERFDPANNPFLFDPELKKLYDNLVRSLKARAKLAGQVNDRPSDARGHPGKLAVAPEAAPVDDAAQSDDGRGDPGSEGRDRGEGKSRDPVDDDFTGALDDVFGKADDAIPAPIKMTAPPEKGEAGKIQWRDSKPGDRLRDDAYTAARNVKIKSVAKAMAKDLGGWTTLDGPKSRYTGVVVPNPITPEDAAAALQRAQNAYDQAKSERGAPVRTQRDKAAIAKDMQAILRGLKEDGDLFGDTPRPSRSMTQEERAQLEARARQSKMRSGKPQGEAGPLFDTQGDLFGGLEETAPQTVEAQLEALNAVQPGWSVGPNGILTNPHTRGGIIDQTMKGERWFVVFGNEWRSAGDFDTRAGAVADYVRAMETNTDPVKYYQLAPLFIEALDGIDPAANDRRGTFVAMIRPLADAGLTRDDVLALKPYFDRFLDDVESGMIDLQGDQDAPGTRSDLEQDRGDANTGDDVGGGDVSPAVGGTRRGTGDRGRSSDQGRRQREGRGSVSDGDASSVGAEGDQGVSGQQRDGGEPAAYRDGAGSRDRSEQGLPDDPGRAEDTERHASDGPDVTDRRRAQAEADKVKVRPADRANIDKTLPLLLPEQRDDVFKAEQRFATPDGHGMLITNGTGTGKTYSGGGVIKRFAQQGKNNILILAPSQGILDAWVEMGADMGLDITKLDDTKSAGKGIVATTYANAAENPTLATREWDLIVPDEAHKLSQNAEGDATGALKTMRAISNRPKDLWWKAKMVNAEAWAAYRDMPGGDTATLSPAQRDQAQQVKNAKRAELDAADKALIEKWQKQPRSKVLMLSATPFAYDKNVDYAEGYLFDYGDDGVTESGSRQDGRNLFMVANFGYRIRYHKLTKPEAAVDTGVFERNFHERLKREGVLTGRQLDIASDYDRKFVKITTTDGEKIDAALKLIQERSGSKGDGLKWRELGDHVRKSFTYLKRMQLLEAIKAEAAVKDIKAHLDMGRKVVVFHDFNKGGGFNPFMDRSAVIPTAAAVEGYNLLLAEMPEVADLNFAGLKPPVEALTQAFGKRARVYNGTVSGKERDAAKRDFNTDGSGVDVIIVQSAAGEAGISLHDTTGGHQRALINLGMPVRPTTTLQEEGRIRRVGSVSDAVFRYYTTGTVWERLAFAGKIAENSGTVENLALGNDARAIRQSFIDAYMDADDYQPSPDDGKGGRDADRSTALTSPYDQAKTHYFARQKNNRRRDQRAGFDFYATPEPLGFKIAEWAGARTYEKALEPSAGDGAIARYLPGDVDRTLVEPSMDLVTKAQLNAPGAKIVNDAFEDHHVVNKYDVVTMNPPFGSGGKMAMEHLAKAFRHVRPGGRIVALIPTGPSADKHFERMLSDDAFPIKEWNFTAEIDLPAVTFEKAGTGVRTRVVIFDRVMDMDRMTPTKHISMTGAQLIGEFFDRLEGIGVPERPAVDVRAEEVEVQAAPAAVTNSDAFETFEFFHTKTAKNKFGVQITENLGDRFKEAAVIAKGHNGYYSRFQDKAAGAKRGFLFNSTEDRDAFMADVRKPILGLEETVWHGTPHSGFDRFDSAFMGTGEGAQAFGWGHYFAGKRDLAVFYRNKLSGGWLRDRNGSSVSQWDSSELYMEAWDAAMGVGQITNGEIEARNEDIRTDFDDGAEEFFANIADVLQHGGPPELDALLNDPDPATKKWADQTVSGLKARGWLFNDMGGGRGSLFTVEIPDASDLLDWDKPLSEQPDRVHLALMKIPNQTLETINDRLEGRGMSPFDEWDDMTGEELVHWLADHEVAETLPEEVPGSSWYTGDTTPQKHAAMYLKSLGIPGHRFLNGQSRRAGEGDHNYVIYDDDAITILERERRGRAGAEAIRPALPALRAELDRLNLKRVRLGEDLTEGRLGAFRAVGGNLEILVGPSLDPEATLHHEVIHALKAMNLFTPAEWKALEMKAARTWVEEFDIPARYPDLLPSEQIEEAIAEAFAKAAKTRAAPKGSVLVQAFNKVARLFKAFGNALRGAGFQTADQVFDRVASGAVGARDAGGTGFVNTLREARPPRRRNSTSMMATAGYAFIPDRRIWEELSAVNAGVWQRLRGGAAAANDWADKARIKIQDRFLPILRAQEAIIKMTGRPLAPDHNAYLAEETFSGKVGRHLFEIDEDFTKPIIDIMAGGKGHEMLNTEYVGTWLYARHAKERNDRIASINPNMPDGGSGMTNAEAAQILADAAASPHAARLQKIGDLVDQLRERTLDLRLSAGLITQTEADIWRNQYAHYVPLKGWADTDHSEALLDVTGVGRRFNTRGAETKTALGRQSEAFNPLQGAITQAQEVAIRAEKNRVGQALYKLAKDFPSPALWSVKTPKQKRYFNRTTGMVETRVEDPVSLFMEPNEMAVKIGGKEHRILFHDMRLAQSAGTVGADQMNWFVAVMSKAARWFSSVNTMLDPEFVIRNAFRDMTSAQINIRNFGKDDRNKLAKAMVKNWPKAWRAAYRGQLNKADTEWTRYYREFEKAGAKVSFWKLDQPEASRGDMDRRLKLAGGNLLQRGSRFVRFSTRDNPVLGFIERVNLAVDNAVRLAAYVEARKQGWSEADAASLSKNLTVNFNRRGEWGASINALYPFANAGIQGTQILFRAMTSKRMAKYAVGLIALGLLNDQINAALSEEDDDGELAYDKIPDWKQQMNLVVMLGPDAGNAATIWLPYGYNLFPYIGTQLGKISRGVKEPGDALADFAAAAFGAFSPLGGRDVQSVVTPTMLDPINEMAMNQDWLGRPIRPESPYDDYGPDAYKYFSGVSNTSRVASDVLNRASGGTIAEPGAIDVSPEYLDYAFGFATGGAGRFAGRATDLVGKLMTGQHEEIEDRDIPFYRSLQTDTGTWLDRDRYYRFRDEVREARDAMKTYQEAGRQVPEDVRRLANLYGANQEAEKQLRAFRKAKNTVAASDTLTAAQISERRAAIDERADAVYLGFNRQFIRIMGRQGE